MAKLLTAAAAHHCSGKLAPTPAPPALLPQPGGYVSLSTKNSVYIRVHKALLAAWFPGAQLPLGIGLRLEVDGAFLGPCFDSSINASRQIYRGLQARKDLAGCAVTAFRRGPGVFDLDVLIDTQRQRNPRPQPPRQPPPQPSVADAAASCQGQQQPEPASPQVLSGPQLPPGTQLPSAVQVPARLQVPGLTLPVSQQVPARPQAPSLQVPAGLQAQQEPRRSRRKPPQVQRVPAVAPAVAAEQAAAAAASGARWGLPAGPAAALPGASQQQGPQETPWSPPPRSPLPLAGAAAAAGGGVWAAVQDLLPPSQA